MRIQRQGQLAHNTLFWAFAIKVIPYALGHHEIQFPAEAEFFPSLTTVRLTVVPTQ